MVCLTLFNNKRLSLLCLTKLFTAAYAMPSFITEPRNVRSLIGDKAKFKLTFSGNPAPGMLSMVFRNYMN